MEKETNINRPHYEILFIIPNKFTAEEAKKLSDEMEALIKTDGGEVTFSEDWGKKKLAYEIETFNHGYYFLIEFDFDAEKINKFNRTLQLDHNILRHNIITIKKRTLEEIKQSKALSEKLAQEFKKEKEPEPEKKKKESTPEKEVEEKKKKADEDKIELQDLDDKLDKILDTKDLI